MTATNQTLTQQMGINEIEIDLRKSIIVLLALMPTFCCRTKNLFTSV